MPGLRSTDELATTLGGVAGARAVTSAASAVTATAPATAPAPAPATVQGALLEITYGPLAGGGVIPGARRLDWQALLWHEAERRLATPEQLACRLGQLGIVPGAPLTVYGDPVQFGAYAAWALEVAGYPDVRLLDGGKEAWIAEGLPLEPAIAEPLLPGGTEPGWRAPGPSGARIDRAGVEGALRRPGTAFLDARSPEEFSGERVSPPEFAVDHGAAVGGRIPGAHHLPHRDLLDERGRFRPAHELDARVRAAGIDPERDEIVTYCRLGHRAALAWYALRHVLGAPRVRVYEGSWTEWGSLVGAPIER